MKNKTSKKGFYAMALLALMFTACSNMGNMGNMPIGSYFSSYTFAFPVSTDNGVPVYKNDGMGFAKKFQAPNAMAGYIDNSMVRIDADVYTGSGFKRMGAMVNRKKWNDLKMEISAANLVYPLVKWSRQGDRAQMKIIAGNTVYILNIAYTEGSFRGATEYTSTGALTGELIECEVTSISTEQVDNVFDL